jgi:hypothetical protein
MQSYNVVSWAVRSVVFGVAQLTTCCARVRLVPSVTDRTTQRHPGLSCSSQFQCLNASFLRLISAKIEDSGLDRLMEQFTALVDSHHNLHNRCL